MSNTPVDLNALSLMSDFTGKYMQNGNNSHKLVCEWIKREQTFGSPFTWALGAGFYTSWDLGLEYKPVANQAMKYTFLSINYTPNHVCGPALNAKFHSQTVIPY